MKLTLKRLSDNSNRFGNYAYEPIGTSATLEGMTATAAGIRLYSPNKVGGLLVDFSIEANVTKRTIGGIERVFYNLPNPNAAEEAIVIESITETLRLAKRFGMEDATKSTLAERLANNVVLPAAKKTTMQQPVSKSQETVAPQPTAEEIESARIEAEAAEFAEMQRLEAERLATAGAETNP